MELDYEQIKWVVKEKALPLIQERDPLSTPCLKRMSVASTIIMQALGTDWYNVNFMPPERKSGYFLRLTDEDSFRRFVMREIEFAELIHNLRKVNNFDERIEEIRRDKRGIESGIATLFAGRFFKQNNIMFEYVKPSGIKTQDYDIDYVRKDSKPGRCEVKCKMQDSTLSESTIHNSLETARKQFPEDDSGIVILRMPEEWFPNIEEMNNLLLVERYIMSWFNIKKTTRISSIVVIVSKTVSGDTSIRTVWIFKEYKNVHCQDVSGLPICILDAHGNAVLRGNWQDLEELCDSWNIEGLPRRTIVNEEIIVTHLKCWAFASSGR